MGSVGEGGHNETRFRRLNAADIFLFSERANELLPPRLLSLPRVEIPFSQLKTNGCDAREQQELGTPKQVLNRSMKAILSDVQNG